MKIYKTILFYSLFLCFSFGIGQEIRFESKVSKSRLGINERLRVSFEMNKDGDNFIAPNFGGFRVVGGPNQSVEYSWVNGRQTFSKKYTFFIVPQKKGTITIGPAKIKIDNKIYTTQPISVEITDAVNNPSQGNTLDYVVDQNLHLVTEVSKTNPYLNEAITVIYKLYFNNQTAISNINEIKNSQYNGFWSNFINIKQYEVKRENYKDREYNYIVWKKVVLYPQKTGVLAIEPLVLNTRIQVPSRRRNFFMIHETLDKEVQTKKRIIQVKDLPEEGKPENFTGAVGNFDFEMTTNKKELKVGESFQLKLAVKGKGNLKLFELPKIKMPNSLEVYTPEYSENITTNLSGMEGKIEDNYTIVANQQGKFPVPVISFSFFDPKTKQYKSVFSKEKIINVLGTSSFLQSNTNKQGNKNIIKPQLNQFHFIKLKTKFISNKVIFFETSIFYILLFAPFLLLIILIFLFKYIRSKNIDHKKIYQKKRARLVNKYLSSAKKYLNKKEDFYVALEKALHNFLKAKLHIDIADFGKEKIVFLLKKKNIASDVTKEYVLLLEACEKARYSPIEKANMKTDYQKAIKIISKIDKEI